MIFLRYRGSHFKTGWQAELMVREFEPMVERGWECHMVLERLPEDTAWVDGFHRLGVQIHCIARPRRRFDVKTIKAAFHLFRRLRPDVVLCENIHSSPLLAATLARVPVRVWIKHAMNSCFETMRKPGVKDRLALSTRLSAWLAHRVIGVSGAVIRELCSLRIPEKKLLLRLNPRPDNDWSKHCDRDAARRRFGYDAGNLVFVSIGHAVAVKGWDLLLDAFSKVVEVNQNARLLLVGGTHRAGEREFTERLTATVERLKLAALVRFTGHVEDIGSCLAASDVFVMSSRSEGYSLALVEAIAMGLPCIATRVGVAEDVIDDNHNGLLVERGKVEPLAEAMLTLSRDHALRGRMSANAVVPDCIPTLRDYSERLADDFESLRRPASRALRSTPQHTGHV